MLDHLSQRAARALASVRTVMLAAYGPSDLLCSRLPCTSHDLTLYVFIPSNSDPSSSDHRLNLEHRPGVVAAADEWDLRETARVLTQSEIPAGIQPPQGQIEPDGPAAGANSAWGRVAAVWPAGLTLHAPTRQGNTEAIGF